MYIKRTIQQEIIRRLEPNKVVVLYGPRQVGKTTLAEHILQEIGTEHLSLSGENRDVRGWLSSQSLETLKQYIGHYRLIVIDEAQKIDTIGVNLKLLVDHIDGIRILATGSSSFALSHQLGEPLVGRQWQFFLFPFSQMELNDLEKPHEREARLPMRLIYGGYPEVVIRETIEDKRALLNGIVDSYLFRDLLELDEIRKSNKILQILKLIAFQIGKEVSLNEISNTIGLNVRTVEKYLDLLEKVFVIKCVPGYSKNLRKEITKNKRFYFYDNGIRNALINNFNDLNTRDDVGQLWENYVVMERLKKQHYQRIYANNYFWRTYDQKEIDWVEERDGRLFGYEIKWQPRKTNPPALWLETYPEAEYQMISSQDYLPFIC